MKVGGWRAAGATILLATGCRVAQPSLHTSGEIAQLPHPVTSTTTAPIARPVVLIASEVPTDAELWRLSRDPEIVKAGQAAFSASSCRTCHGLTLTGGAAPNLVDHRWLHGGTPQEVFATITRGVPSKGMPTWGPVLGPKIITSLVAYIFSHHREGEPIEVQASFTPFTPSYETP